MKVVMINGSPHKNGSTAEALREVGHGLTDGGAESELLHIGAEVVPGRRGCFACRTLQRCVIDDCVNRAAEILLHADGRIVASPVYFSSPTGTLISFLDRLYAAHGEVLVGKPFGSLTAARRGGTTIALTVLNQYALVGEQPIIPSCYWCTAAHRRKCAPMQRGCASPIRWASAWRNTPKGSAKDKAGARTFSVRAPAALYKAYCSFLRNSRFLLMSSQRCLTQSGLRWGSWGVLKV